MNRFSTGETSDQSFQNTLDYIEIIPICKKDYPTEKQALEKLQKDIVDKIEGIAERGFEKDFQLEEKTGIQFSRRFPKFFFDKQILFFENIGKEYGGCPSYDDFSKFLEASGMRDLLQEDPDAMEPSIEKRFAMTYFSSMGRNANATTLVKILKTVKKENDPEKCFTMLQEAMGEEEFRQVFG